MESVNNVPVDVATLSELSESSILSCLEERFSNQHFQSYVGQVLLSVDPVWRSLPAAQGALLAPEFAADVLQNTSSLGEDYSIVLCGYQGSGKTVVLHQLLASLIGGLASKPQLEQKVIDAMWLLQALTTQTSGLAQDGRSVASGNQALVGVRLVVKDGKLLGCALSCLLLNTTDFRHFSVFQLNGVRERLEAVGLSSTAVEQFMKMLVELDLLGEGQLSNMVAGSEAMEKKERERLAELLYAHLIHWLVCHLNKELAPPTTAKGYYHIDLYDPPGVAPPAHSSETGGLMDLVQTYINEIMHNIYCHRLFLWEQDQYIDDGVEWEYIPVQTNDVLIEAFQQTGGMLDAVGGSDARAIATAVARACQAHPDLCFTTQDENTFILSHFTGERCYTVSEEWIRTNSAHLRPSDQALQSLLSSPNDLLCLLSQSISEFSPDNLFGMVWPSGINLTGRLHQMAVSLLEAITTSQPQFVLCLSPLPTRPDSDKLVEIDRVHMLAQLQQFRILDIALIQSCGYPVHIEMGRFVSRYSSLLMEGRGSSSTDSRDLSATTQAVLTKRTLSDYRIGKTQVFLKPWHLRQLDSELELFQTSARKLQQAFRRSCLQRHSEHLRLESAVKGVLEQRGGDYDSVSTDSGSSEGEGERGDGSLGGSDSAPLMDDAVRRNSSPTVGEHGALPTCKMEGDGLCPPSPPPRPKHTLSQDSFSVDNDRIGPLTSRGIPSPGRGSPTKSRGMPSGSGTHSSRQNPKKASWRKPKRRPAANHDPMVAMTAGESFQQGSWYHGKVSRDLAERCLKEVSFDSFLVRESEKRVGEYSLSLKHKGIVKHFRIDVKRGSRIRYELFGAQKSFPTLPDLIDYYSRHCITTVGETLMAPCPPEGSSEATPPPLPPPRRKNLSSIRRKEPPEMARTQRSKRSPAPLVRNGSGGSGTRPLSVVQSFDLSDESVATLLRELEIEERIVDAARRMADMPARNRKEKQQRRQSLQQAQSRLLSLRQQYHTIQERKRFIEVAISNVPTPNRRVSSPAMNTVH